MPRIPESKLDDAGRIFLAWNRQHDGTEFSRFSDTGWLYEDEIRYKHRVWYRANDALDLPSWSALAAVEGTICDRVGSAFEVAENLVLRRWGDVSYRGWTDPAAGHVAELEDLTRELMTSGNDRSEVVSSFDRLCEFLRKHRRPCQWPPMSYLLFLRDKQTFFPVHSGECQALLDALGVDARISGRVNGCTLFLLLETADTLRSHLEIGGYMPRDAIDVQSFMWVVAKNLEMPVRKPVGEPDWDRELQRRNRMALQQQATGLRGEHHVYDRERARLTAAGRHDLADRVELVSATMSDSGYDIRSFEDEGDEVHIEVKTTARPVCYGLTVFVTECERQRAETDPNWRLCVVHDDGNRLKMVCQSRVLGDDRFNWRRGGWELDIAPAAMS